MKIKELKFLEKKLSELVDNDIINKSQFEKAYNYFDSKKEKKSVSIIFSALGLLLICLSVITLFSVNWKNIPREFKCVIAFIPLIITSVLLYFTIKKDNKKLKLSTSIVAPMSIIATNSLIGQIFHMHGDIYNLIFVSLLMFMPISLIIRNNISLIVYGVGVIIYSFFREELINVFILDLPLIIYNIYIYLKYKTDKKNILLWTFNLIIITVVLFTTEIVRSELFLLYSYIMSLITKILFNNDNKLSKIISFLLMFYLFVFCISQELMPIVEDITFEIDTLIGIFISIGLFILSKDYKNIKEYFMLFFVFLCNFPLLNETLMFILFNLLLLCYGIYKIISGYKTGLPKSIKKGIAIILYLIFLRFISAEISFGVKSLLFLSTGIIFIVGSKIFKNRIEEVNNDEEK